MDASTGDDASDPTLKSALAQEVGALREANESAGAPSAPAPAGDISWENVTDDGLVKKATLRATSMKVPLYPVDGMELKVHYTGTLPYVEGADEPFDCSRKRKTPFTFTLGHGAVIAGWDEAFCKVAVGETALIEVGPAYGYGSEGHPPVIPPDAHLRFEVELLSAAVKKKELHQLTAEEKYELSTLHKAKGLELFAAKEWKGARRAFAEAVHYCDASTYTRNDKPLPDDVAAVYLSCHLNASQCALNAKEWPAAAAYATRAVRLRPDSVKALYRRGVARSRMGLLDEARADLKKAAALDPKNKPVRVAWAELKTLVAEQTKGQKTTFKGAFDKVSLFGDKPSNVLHPSETENPYVFFRIRALPKGGEGDAAAAEGFDGTLVLRVYEDSHPKTAKNFLALARGDKGRGRVFGKPLAYAGTPIHRVAKDFMIQGGDVVAGDGTSGESIYGKTFKDEHTHLKFDAPGCLSMANSGPDTNQSQWFITCDEAPHLDGKHVVFGKLVAGMAFLKQLANLDADADGAPKFFSVKIAQCDVLDKHVAVQMIAEDKREAKAAALEAAAAKAEPAAATPEADADAAASDAKMITENEL